MISSTYLISVILLSISAIGVKSATTMADDKLTVKTSLGTVKGTLYKTERNEGILCYQGIPYAKPPIDQLRFKDPVPIEPWTGILSAEKPPPMAANLLYIPGKIDMMLFPNSSEDCLYLNVFVPEKGGKDLPVMVYIHGGGFTSGTGNKDWYGPDYLVPKNVILVNINYRLGPFGFLSFNNSECPGNFGMKDQVLGLKWVKENIKAFGGNPNNVTLFGESAGAASVHYHLLSPLSRGLFQRAIAMSGSALNKWAYARYPKESATLLAKNLGSSVDDPTECLKVINNASTFDVLKATVGIFEEIQGLWAAENAASYAFVPTAEPVGTPNAFLTKTPKQAVEDGDTLDVPFIAGTCAHEAIFALPQPDYVPADEEEVYEKMLPKELGLPLGSPKMKEAAKKLKEYYFPNGPTQAGWIKAVTSLLIGHGVYRSVKYAAMDPERTSENHLYIFNISRNASVARILSNTQNLTGVAHGDDLEYFFKFALAGITGLPILPGTTDDDVMNHVTSLWTDFARTGHVPIAWKSATPNPQTPYADLTQTLIPREGYFGDEMKFWDDIYQFLSE